MMSGDLCTGDQVVTRCGDTGHWARPHTGHHQPWHTYNTTYTLHITHAISISPAYCILPSSEEWAVIAGLLDSC